MNILNKNKEKEQELHPVLLSFLAISIGIAAGIGAWLFRLLIASIHNFSFNGFFSLEESSNSLEGISFLGIWIIFVPIIGGLIVTYLVRNFAPEARGHGVPEVMDSVYFKSGKIRARIVLIKSLASALSIGTGASVGREGPIVQIGAAFGSSVSQLIHLIQWQRTTLLAAGAAAGIAATFNTPLGGVLFATEILLLEVSSRTFLPLALATGTSTYISRILIGAQPAFDVPMSSITDFATVTMPQFLIYVLLGLFCGMVAFLFIRMLSYLEEIFQESKFNDYLGSIIGMGTLGIIMYILGQNYGHYHVAGVGYGTIQGILHGDLTDIYLLFGLVFLKMFSTSISLASGSSGGIFSPSLFLGASLGAGLGVLINSVWPEAAINPVEFAIIGMGGVVAGATGAAMTSIVMLFEMTRDYNIIIPLIMAVGISVVVRRIFSKENIYTIKLRWKGRIIPKERHLNMFLALHAKEVMETSFVILDGNKSIVQCFKHLADNPDATYILITEDDIVKGVIAVGLLEKLNNQIDKNTHLKDIMTHQILIAKEDDTFRNIMNDLGTSGWGTVVLVLAEGQFKPEAKNVRGVIGKIRITDAILSYFK